MCDKIRVIYDKSEQIEQKNLQDDPTLEKSDKKI